MPSIPSVRRSRLAAAIAAALLVVSLSACAAPGSGGSAQGSSGKQEDPQKAFDEWQLRFAECMRGKGVDMPDPGKDGSTIAIPLDDDAFRTAMDSCMSALGQPPSVDGKSDQEILDDQLKTAQCLRDAGYPAEDPVKGQAMALPGDLPEDVMQKCFGAPAGAGKTAQ